MKTLLYCFLGTFLAFSVSAQKLDIGINLMTGQPVGDYTFGDNIESFNLPPGFGIGGGIELNYWFGDAFSIGFEAGYLAFAMQEHQLVVEDSPFPLTAEAKSAVIPLIIKGTYTFQTGALKPFVSLGVGYLIYDPNMTIVTPAILFVPEQRTPVEWTQNGLFISPRVGVVYTLSDLLALNLNVQYNLAFNELTGNVDVTVDGETEQFEDANISATNYLGINLGVLITLFE